MPTYSYACTLCEKHFDVQQSFTDDALTECPECGSRLRKLFGNVGVVFKGSGFYRTDARREAEGGSAAAKGAGDSGGSEPATVGAPKDGGSSGSTSEGSGSSSATSGSSDGAGSSGGSGTPGTSGATSAGGSNGSKASKASPTPTPSTAGSRSSS